ncbi:MAG: peptidoglycan bridge formation glycyltransferase FemA/FemB family protein [Candidatus Magasanikbacteria bacterium]
MEIIMCNNQKEWESFFFLQDRQEFLQSWEWGKFQKSVGNEPIRLRITEDQQVVGQVQGFIQRLGPGFRYVYMPRIMNYESGIMDLVFEYAKDQKYAFVRVEPIDRISNFKFQISNSNNRQPKDTLLLDITKEEDEILADMHTKTRYNIRLAIKKGVEVKQEKDAEVFWKLNEETTSRDAFKSHGKEYYEKMLEMDSCHQLTAYFEGSPIASNICIASGDTFTYLHGASSSTSRNIMAPYLLQWEGMKLSKSLGYKKYDFWGIAKPIFEDVGMKSCYHGLCWDVTDKWTGITRFKAGFGGVVRSYPEAVDVVLSGWKYKLYSIAKKFL